MRGRDEGGRDDGQPGQNSSHYFLAVEAGSDSLAGAHVVKQTGAFSRSLVDTEIQPLYQGSRRNNQACLLILFQLSEQVDLPIQAQAGIQQVTLGGDQGTDARFSIFLKAENQGLEFRKLLGCT